MQDVFQPYDTNDLCKIDLVHWTEAIQDAAPQDADTKDTLRSSQPLKACEKHLKWLRIVWTSFRSGWGCPNCYFLSCTDTELQHDVGAPWLQGSRKRLGRQDPAPLPQLDLRGRVTVTRGTPGRSPRSWVWRATPSRSRGTARFAFHKHCLVYLSHPLFSMNEDVYIPFFKF